jgi:hypothetical protein
MDASGIAVNNDSQNDIHQESRKDRGDYRRIKLSTGATRRRRQSHSHKNSAD